MLKLLKKLNKKEIIFILISICFITLQVYLDLKIPDYMTEITTYVQTEGTQIKDILNPGSKAFMCLRKLGLICFSWIFSFIYSSKFFQKIKKRCLY